MNAAPDVTNSSSSSLVGTWRLLTFDVEDQATQLRHPLFGKAPNGRAIFLRTGIMMVIITAEDRPIPKTAEDKANAFNSLIAYTGRYKVEGDTFSTEVDISWNEAWTRTNQLRSWRFVGDKLQLTSAWAPSPFDPETIARGVLEWEREE